MLLEITNLSSKSLFDQIAKELGVFCRIKMKEKLIIACQPKADIVIVDVTPVKNGVVLMDYETEWKLKKLNPKLVITTELQALGNKISHIRGGTLYSSGDDFRDAILSTEGLRK